MAEEKRLNILITAKDEAGKVFQELARLAEEMAKSFETSSKAAMEAFGSLERSAKTSGEETGKAATGGAQQTEKAMKKLTEAVFMTREELVKDVETIRHEFQNLDGVNLDHLTTGQLKQLSKAVDETKTPIITLKNTFEESLAAMEKVTTMTSKELTARFDEVKKSINNEEIAMLSSAQVSESFAKKVVESVDGAKIVVVKDMQEMVKEITTVNQSLETITKTVYMTKGELVTAFDAVKGSFNNESLAAVNAAQMTDSAMAKIVSAANNMKVEVIKSLDDMASKEISAAEKSAQAAQHAKDAHTTAMSQASMDAQMAGQQIQGVGSSISGFFGKAIMAAAEFDQAVVNTSASLNSNLKPGIKLTTEQVDTLKSKALELGRDGYYSANQVGEAMNVMARQGINYEQIMGGAINTVATVAAANQQDISETANVVSDIIHEMGAELRNEFGPDTKAQMTGIGDAMTGAMHHARISMEDFLNTMKYVGPQAGQAGLSIKDVSAAIAILGEHGIRGSQAGTALRRMLTNLMPSSAGAAQAMEYLGIKITDVFDKSTGKLKNFTEVQKVLHDKMHPEEYQPWIDKFKEVGLATEDGASAFLNAKGKMLPMNEVLQMLHDKFGKMTPAMEQMAVKAIFGQYALSGMTAIIDTAPEEFSNMVDAMGKTGVAQDLVNEKSTGLGMQIARLNAHFQTFIKDIGERLKPQIEAVINVLHGLMTKFEALPGPVKTTIAVIGAVTGVVLVVGGALLAVIGTIGMFAASFAAGWAVVMTVIATVGSAFWGLLGIFESAIGGIVTVLMANPIIALIVAIVAAVAFAAYEIYKHWDSVKKWFTDAGTYISQIWTKFINDFSVMWNKFGRWLNDLGKSISKGWNEMCTAIGNIWHSFTTWLQQKATEFVNDLFKSFQWLYDHWYPFQHLVDAIVNAWKVIAKFTPVIWHDITTYLTNIWDTIKDYVTAAWDVIKSVIQHYWGIIKLGTELMWKELTDYLSKKWNGIVTVAKEIWAIVEVYFNHLWAIIKYGTELAWNDIKQRLSNFWHGIVDEVSPIFNTLGTFFKNLWNEAKQWGSNLIKMFVDGINEKASMVADASKKIAADLVKFLGFHSPTEEGPASDSDTWAPNFVNMFADGLANGADKVATASAQLVAPIKQAYKDITEFSKDQVGTVTDAAAWIINAKSTWEDAAKNHDQGAMDSAHQMAEKYRTDLEQMGFDSSKFGADKSIVEAAKNNDDFIRQTSDNMKLNHGSMTKSLTTDMSTMSSSVAMNEAMMSESWHFGSDSIKESSTSMANSVVGDSQTVQATAKDMSNTWGDASSSATNSVVGLHQNIEKVLGMTNVLVKNQMESIKGTFVQAFFSIADSAETAMNRVVNAMNAMRVAQQQSQQSANVGGGGFDASSLPAFANGGRVDRPTIALIGEGGEPEYVIPESKLKNEDFIGGMHTGVSPLPTTLSMGAAGMRNAGRVVHIEKIEVNVNGLGKDSKRVGSDLADSLRQQLAITL